MITSIQLWYLQYGSQVFLHGLAMVCGKLRRTLPWKSNVT